MTLCRTAVLLVFGITSSMAFAGDQPPGASGRAISFDELKARCQHPEQFDVQKAPQNIRVQCAETRHEFVPSEPGTLPMENDSVISTAVLADKFFVNLERANSPMSAQSANCLRYKEIEQKLNVESPLTCDEILGIKGTLADYCSSQLVSARQANAQLVQAQDTGRMIDTCAAAQQSKPPESKPPVTKP